MSERTKALSYLLQEANKGTLILRDGGGRDARQQVEEARKLYNEARQALLRHELATNYRVAILGRVDPTEAHYAFTVELAKALAESSEVDVITGAGKGIMQAALEGVALAKQEAKAKGNILNSRRLGIGITISTEDGANPFVEDFSQHSDFPTRIQEFADMSHAAYFAPGWIGTYVELLFFMQIKDKGHLERDFPIIVHPAWRESMESLHKSMYQDIFGYPNPILSDPTFIIYSDNIPEIVGIIAIGQKRWQETIGQHVRRG